MNSETRNCQNCKKDFVIDPDDFDFYAKIKVPPPTWCPQCRVVRRMIWRNDWHLFKKPEALKGESIFSFFPPEAPVKIYDRDYYWSDAWDAMNLGEDIDWSRPFFKQFGEFLGKVPMPAHSTLDLVNCEYCTNASHNKNLYLCAAISHAEDCAYVIWDGASRRCMDSHMTDHCELGYGNVNCTRCYKALFSVNCEDCQNVTLSKDCVGCSNCFGCVGLRSRSYCIFNMPHTKEEYQKKLEEMNLGSWKALRENRDRAFKFWLSVPVKFMQGLQNTNVTGDYIYNSKNAIECYRSKGMEDCKYCMNMLNGPVKNCYDSANWGAVAELMYETLVCGDQNYALKFCWNCYPSNKNLTYCVFCASSSDLFACIGLRKKQYCIFNKQYSKEEYESLLPKLIEHMSSMPYKDTKGRTFGYGEFFPPDLCPYPYNVTAAYEFFPKTEQEIIDEGSMWRKEEDHAYNATLSAGDIPDDIRDVPETIMKEVIACSDAKVCAHECTGAFRIILQELQFLKQLGIPLPRLCPNCRHGERLLLRNAPKFWKRKCTCLGNQTSGIGYRNVAKHFHGGLPCPDEFETSYPPESPVLVYCESCYQAEVA
jgi:hypothetical protein